jgi:hypothetical protein
MNVSRRWGGTYEPFVDPVLVGLSRLTSAARGGRELGRTPRTSGANALPFVLSVEAVARLAARSPTAAVHSSGPPRGRLQEE